MVSVTGEHTATFRTGCQEKDLDKHEYKTGALKNKA
jgi:hypothetical protein